MTEDRRGKVRGAARWYSGRFLGLKSVSDIAARNLAAGYETGRDAFSALKPKGYLSRRSFLDKYSDGGIQRFKDLSHGLSAEEIERSLKAWDRDSSIYMIAGCLGLIGVPVAYYCEVRSIYMLIGACLLALTAFALAIKADFRAWQIRQGRFGSLNDYFRGRLPSNMQIITRDDDQ